MRRLGRLLAWLTALGLATWALYLAAPYRDIGTARSAPGGADPDERVLFEPLSGRALAFNAATHQGWFAVQGFVVAPLASRAAGLPLTVEIGVHGPSGVVHSRLHFFLPAGSHPQPYGWLEGAADAPVWILPTHWIDLSGREDVRAVSVRVVSAPEGVEGILWYGVKEERLSEAQARSRYRRQRTDAREALVAKWVTPAAAVHPDVKRELLRHLRVRVGPLGRIDEAFATRRVWRKLPGGAPAPRDDRPLAMAISPTLPVAFDLPHATEVVIDGRSGNNAPMRLQHVGDAAAPAPPTTAGPWRVNLPRGRHELRAAHAGSVEVRDARNGESILPDGLRIRAHRATADRLLDYRLFALGDAPQPVRLRLRADGADTRATIEFFDGAGTPLSQLRLDVPWRTSGYDRFALSLAKVAGDPVTVDLAVPRGAERLRVSAAAPTMVQALTRVPAGGWHSFQPVTDPRSVLSQGLTIVEQPRAQRASARHGSREPATPTGQRHWLRLRPIHADAMEEADAE